MKRKKRRLPESKPTTLTRRVKKSFSDDHAARLRACLWAVSLTFGYGVFNDLILGRPEQRVATEAIAVCVVTLGIQYVLFHASATPTSMRNQFVARLWCRIEAARHKKMGRLIGATTMAFVLCAVPIGKVTPSIEAAALRKSDVGLLPGMDAGLTGTRPDFRFNEVSTRLETAIREKKIANPASVKEAKESLASIIENVRLPENVSFAAKRELAYLQAYESLSRIGAADPQVLRKLSSGYVPGMPAVFGAGIDKTTLIATPTLAEFTETDTQPKFFSDFSVVSFGHAAGAPPPEFAVTHGDNTATIFNDIKVAGFAQNIGNLTWTNVIFVGSLIRYHGEPIRMANVTFVNCTFEHSPDSRGQALLDYLTTHQGESVSAYVP